MTPSPPTQAEASETVEQMVKRLIPDKGCSCNQGRLERLGYHDEWCPMHYRPTVAAALQSERDSRDRRIAELEAALKPFAKAASYYDFDEPDGLNDWAGKIRIGDLRKAKRALTPGEKS